MTPEVGKDVASLCSKCGDVWHVVVAKVGQDIVQVLCKECGARHRYRNPKKEAMKSAAPARPRAPRAPSASIARIDEPAVKADLSRPSRRYGASEVFAVGDRVDHPSFGQGVVEAMPDLGKMTVFFATGRRVLVCGKPAAAGGGGLAKPRPIDHSGPPAGGKPVTR